MSTSLTPRRVTVLALMAQGHTDKQIARLLVISERTVRAHIIAIEHALQATNRAHAVAIGFERGHIPIPGEARAEARLPPQRSDH